MVIKAILTGGVLSVLAGSIVYFGTEGADALEGDTSADVRLDETELAGAAESTADKVDAMVKTPEQTSEKRKAKVEARKAKARAKAAAKVEAKALAKAEAKAKSEAKALAKAEAEQRETFETVSETVVVQPLPLDMETVPEEVLGAAVVAPTVKEPPVQTSPETSEKKPKTRWLDQYLKSDKKKPSKAEGKSEVIDVAVEKADMDEDLSKENFEMETEVEIEVKDPQAMKKIRQKKVIVKMDGDKKMVWSSDDGDMDDPIDMQMIESLLGEDLDLDLGNLSDGETNIRIIKMDDLKAKRRVDKISKHRAFDYDAVLNEAKKLQVIDMRNQAFLEIVDFAVDRGDIGNAADIVEELSSPELRDTARAKIGVGLANSGDMDAAFAVLEEIEIDELAAPIRLEIIAALVATRAERETLMPRR